MFAFIDKITYSVTAAYEDGTIPGAMGIRAATHPPLVAARKVAEDARFDAFVAERLAELQPNS